VFSAPNPQHDILSEPKDGKRILPESLRPRRGERPRLDPVGGWAPARRRRRGRPGARDLLRRPEATPALAGRWADHYTEWLGAHGL